MFNSIFIYMTTFIEINQNEINTRVNITQQIFAANTPELITTTGLGTWNKPEGVTRVLVECWGGGGAGGGCTTPPVAGDGGAGGQYARKMITYSSPAQNISYSVAASVTGSTGDGTTGNDTTWDTNVVVAKGGAGGLGNQTSGSGTNGSTAGGIGDVVYAGSNGTGGVYDGSAAIGGNGGNGAGSTGVGTTDLGGTGGAGVLVTGFSGDAASGGNYGGGGAGAGIILSSNRRGGNGAQGLIRITTYTNTVPGVPTTIT